MAYGARLESELGRESLESSNLSPSARNYCWVWALAAAGAFLVGWRGDEGLGDWVVRTGNPRLAGCEAGEMMLLVAAVGVDDVLSDPAASRDGDAVGLSPAADLLIEVTASGS